MLILQLSFFSLATQEIPAETLVTLMDSKNTSNDLPKESTEMTPLNGPTKEVEKEPPKPPAPIKSHWIDRVARVIFPLVYFSFIAFYWVHYINHPESALGAVTEWGQFLQVIN